MSERDRNTLSLLSDLDREALIGSVFPGFAHDIRTPLSYVRANLFWLESKVASLRKLGEHMADAKVTLADGRTVSLADLLTEHALDEGSEELDEVFSDCRIGLEKMSELVSGFRALTVDRKDATPYPFDVCKAVTSAVYVAYLELGHSATVQFEAPEVDVVTVGRSSEFVKGIARIILHLSRDVEKQEVLLELTPSEDKHALRFAFSKPVSIPESWTGKDIAESIPTDNTEWTALSVGRMVKLHCGSLTSAESGTLTFQFPASTEEVT